MNEVITDEEKKKLMKNFTEIDEDGNGVLSKDELVKAFIETYNYLTKEKAGEIVDEIMRTIDCNMDGEIEVNEFLLATIKREELISLDRLKKAFKLLDKDGDGVIEKSEFKEIFKCMPQSDEDYYWNKFISEYDTNCDGYVIYYMILDINR